MHPTNTLVTVTAEEEEALNKFREQIQEVKLYNSEDYFLLKWLRARDLDVGKATKMLEDHLEWKYSSSVLKEISTYEPSKVMTSNCMVRFLGYDEMNRLVLYLPIGRYNFKNIFQAGEKKLLEIYCHQLLDKALNLIEEQRKLNGATQLVALVDMKELSFQQITHIEGMQFIISFGRVFEANYPELLHKGIVVNAPWIFPRAFNLVKPVISTKTLEKISIYNSDSKQWKPALQEILPDSLIPMELA